MMMVENLVEDGRHHLCSPMNGSDDFVEFVTRRRREEVESRSLGRRLDGFQSG
jgi:hypothetical protein